MQFEFATATRILFGSGTLPQAATSAKEMGRHILLITGSTAERAEPLRQELAKQSIETVPFAVSEEPTIDIVQRGTQLARSEHCDVVVGMGGGSVLDAGKAIAALLTNGGAPLDYLEVIGHGKSLTQPSAPFIAIPTTAGTGSEVTCNAVLGSPEHRTKVSLRSPGMFPRLAVIDPQLTLDLPRNITASTGLDALTQVLEPLVSKKANPLTDAICRAGLERIAQSLRPVYQDGHNESARTKMALASLFGGLALANAKLGAVHGFAGPFGGMFPAPHGATCAALLPHVMEANVLALNARQPDSPALQRYDEVAQVLTGNTQATAMDGTNWVHQLCAELQVPPLRDYGLTEAEFPTLIDKATQSSSMKGNPIELTKSELVEILQRAC
ncbi:MAG: iron-containing alcohol dehydrogenase [Pirellulales bacterium]